MNTGILSSFHIFLALILLAVSNPALSQNDEVVIWKSQAGSTFEVRGRKRENGIWILSILKGNEFGKIIIQGNKATMEVVRDLSRFRIEGDAPRTRIVVGTYANGKFTFGNEVYEQVASPPQADHEDRRKENVDELEISRVAFRYTDGQAGTLARGSDGRWTIQTSVGADLFSAVRKLESGDLLLSNPDPSPPEQVWTNRKASLVELLDTVGDVVANFAILSRIWRWKSSEGITTSLDSFWSNQR